MTDRRKRNSITSTNIMNNTIDTLENLYTKETYYQKYFSRRFLDQQFHASDKMNM